MSRPAAAPGRTDGRGTVVEFAGVPGSGKTTLARHTLAALAQHGVASTLADASVSAAVRRPVRMVRRLALACAQISRQPRYAISALAVLRAIRQDSLRDRLAGVVQWFAVQRIGARTRRRAGVHLLEEGEVQTMLTLALRVRRHDRAGGALLRPPARYRPDLVVVVEASVGLASSRLAARPSAHSRTQRLAEPARSAELERGRRLLDQILDRTDCPQLRVTNDGTMTPEELGRRVAEWLRGMSEPGARDLVVTPVREMLADDSTRR